MKLRPALAPLLPLVPLYWSALAAKESAYKRGWLQVHRLRWPVVSVGNLSVGGAGKTPVVIYLARLLSAAGISVDVLSRGYGRSSREVARVDPAGSAAEYGDEPLLIARAAGVPVFVGQRRYEAGLLAEQTQAPGPHVHLLDDGFQHRQLSRAVDIVLLHRSDFNAALLPAGRLREPLRALRRADVVVLREEDAEMEPIVRKYARRDALFWHVQRRLVLPPGLGRVAAFCAIARPQEFFDGLQRAGATLVHTAAWRDHHSYSVKDIAKLKRLAGTEPVEAFVTTGKDAVRLGGALRAELECVAPLRVAELEVRFADEDSVLEHLISLLSRSSGWKAL